MTEEFFRLHPDWDARYGERGRQRCVEDECFHLEFLAGAVSGGSPDAFAGYARWAAGVLSARGIEPRFLAEALGLIGQALADTPARRRSGRSLPGSLMPRVPQWLKDSPPGPSRTRTGGWL